jgi:hypothetical protein
MILYNHFQFYFLTKWITIKIKKNQLLAFFLFATRNSILNDKQNIRIKPFLRNKLMFDYIVAGCSCQRCWMIK